MYKYVICVGVKVHNIIVEIIGMVCKRPIMVLNSNVNNTFKLIINLKV